MQTRTPALAWCCPPLLSVVLCACGSSESVALGERTVDGGTSGGGAAGTFTDPSSGASGTFRDPGMGARVDAGATGSSGPGAVGATRDQFCSNAPGTGILIPGTNECTGDLGKRTFLFGLCSCTDLSLTGVLSTDSFDSKTNQSGTSGSVGVTGNFMGSAVFNIGGSLWVSGGGATGGPAILLTGVNTINQELHVGGDLNGNGFLTVGSDAYVDGSAVSSGLFLTIGGTLHVPVGAAISAFTKSSQTVRQPVAVADPCNCGNPPDVASIVHSFATANDDAASGFGPDALTGLPGVTDLTLGCGRYYFDRVAAVSGVTHVRLTGRTAIFVDGDFDVGGLFSMDFDPQAELDLFVKGNVSMTGVHTFGLPGAPARFRMYVGGTTVDLTGVSSLGVNLHATRATFIDSGVLTLWGSLYARTLNLSGNESFHYDSAVLDIDGCTPPGQSCHDCSGATPACNQGTCGACASNADCCAPLECSMGVCVPPSVVVR